MKNISPKAIIGKGVSICPTALIHGNVQIGDNTIIDSYCKIGITTTDNNKRKRLIIGSNSHIRSHSIFYDNAEYGDHLVTGHHVLARSNLKAGKYFQIGSYTELEGDNIFGDYVKIHSKVMIASKINIGDFTWIFPRVQFTNDPLPPSNNILSTTIGAMSVIATGALIFPGINIGMGAFVAAGSILKNDVPDTHCVEGNPASFFTRIDRLIDFKNKIKHPWPNHFRIKYPKESFEDMDIIMNRIKMILNRSVNDDK